MLAELRILTPMIDAAAYDPETGTLQVTFRPWDVAEFRHVPELVVHAWLIAKRPDDFFDRRIRYRYASRMPASRRA